MSRQFIFAATFCAFANCATTADDGQQSVTYGYFVGYMKKDGRAFDDGVLARPWGVTDDPRVLNKWLEDMREYLSLNLMRSYVGAITNKGRFEFVKDEFAMQDLPCKNYEAKSSDHRSDAGIRKLTDVAAQTPQLVVPESMRELLKQNAAERNSR
jgi:hypothetical protein